MVKHRIAILMLLAASAFSAKPMAQTVLTVDANGTGQFLDLPAAVDAASHGDILRVRPGDYTGFITDKGIHILGEPGVRVVRGPKGGAVVWGRCPPGQQFTLRNVEVIRGFAVFGPSVGKIVVDQVNAVGSMSISKCSDAHVSRSAGRISIFKSNVSIEDCQSVGFAIGTFILSAISAIDSRVELSRCSVEGGISHAEPVPAIWLRNTDLVLRGFDGMTHHVLAGAGTTATPTAAIVGTGTVLRDPRVPVVGANGSLHIEPGINTVAKLLPTLQSKGTGIGQPLNLTLHAQPGELYGVAMGLPHTPVQVPGLKGSLLLENLSIASVGTINPRGQFILRSMIPNDPALIGLQVGSQAFAGASAANMSFSNRTAFTVGF